MKLGAVFFIGSIGLFTSGILEAKEHDDRRRHDSDRRHEQRIHDHRKDDRHEKKAQRRDEKKHHGRRHDHGGQRHVHGNRHRHDRDRRIVRHQRRHHNRHHDFWGGVVIGGLAASVIDGGNYCPDHDRYHGSHHRSRDNYWSNRRGECFRIEQRRHRDVYIEVPRYKCR